MSYSLLFLASYSNGRRRIQSQQRGGTSQDAAGTGAVAPEIRLQLQQPAWLLQRARAVGAGARAPSLSLSAARPPPPPRRALSQLLLLALRSYALTVVLEPDVVEADRQPVDVLHLLVLVVGEAFFKHWRDAAAQPDS